MIGILGGMGTQAGLDFCNKLAVLNRGKIDQEYPLFVLYNKSNIPGRPESIGTQTKNLSNLNTNKSNKTKYNKVLKSLLEGCKLLEKNKCKFIVMPCNTAHYWYDDLKKKIADYEIELSALEFTELRTLAALANGGHPGAESSIIKIKGTELQQRLTEMYVEAAGQYILPYEGPEGFNSNNTPASNVSDFSSQAVSRYLNFRKTSIYGGSNEIQKNIIAKAILGV